MDPILGDRSDRPSEGSPKHRRDDPAGVPDALIAAIATHILGKRDSVELAVTCLLAEGHLLLDDVPGVGKTSLARALAHASGVVWHRIQFAPDLLPSDITGVSVWDQGSGAFSFHAGPVFSSVLLADEINRATPRTQTALLEAMEERTVTVDGVTHALPKPFMVIATQNPVDMVGTYPLPEAQLDRFLIRLSIGYPDHDAEVAVVARHHDGAKIDDIEQAVHANGLLDLIARARATIVDASIQDYIVRLVTATRRQADVVLGASPRGSVGLLRAAKARALVRGRTFVLPGDVQALAVPVLAHRLILQADAHASGTTQEAVVARLVAEVAAPQGT